MNSARPIAPAVDIFENSDEILLYADMPGTTKETLSLNVEGDVLSIEGTIALKLPEGANPLYTEVETARYARNFTLSRELDTSRIDAQMQEGVLRVRIPKQDSAKPRKIAVQQISS